MSKLQQSHLQIKEENNQICGKIYFCSHVYGKPTKNRSQDPSMFDLLKWNNQGVQIGSFKKKETFKNSQQAYLNMISRQPWKSQTQQSYINYLTNNLQVNLSVFTEIQNYVDNHQSTKSKMTKNKEKIPQKQKGDRQVNNQKEIKQIPAEKSKKYHNSKLKATQKVQKQKNDRPSSSIRKVSKVNQNRINSAKHQTDIFQTDQQQKIVARRDQITQEEQTKLIQKFKQTTRWIPNSSFTTYFGRPPFQNYGRGNTKPVDGGLIYGTYLYSHNVHPHRGANSPTNIQTYPVALMKAKSQGNLIPTQPKTICNYLQNKINNQKQKQYDNYGSIQAVKNVYGNLQIQVPNLSQVQKFGGKKKQLRRTSQCVQSKSRKDNERK